MLTAAQRRELRAARRQLKAWRDPGRFPAVDASAAVRFRRGAWVGFRLAAGLVLIAVAFGLGEL